MYLLKICQYPKKVSSLITAQQLVYTPKCPVRPVNRYIIANTWDIQLTLKTLIKHGESRDIELALKSVQMKHWESRDIELILKTLNMENLEIYS